MTHHRNATKANLNRPIYAHVKSHDTDFTIFRIITENQTTIWTECCQEKQLILFIISHTHFRLRTITSLRIRSLLLV